MRHDNIGLFWEDLPKEKGKIVREMPPIPDTGWKCPTSFPDLSSAPCIAIDVETYDPGLKQFGPGWARRLGHLVGVSVGIPNGGRWYFPMRHEINPEENMNPDHVLAWLRDTLGNASQPKIGANIIYDIGWLEEEGVEVKGDLIDIQFAEALLDEASNVALESIAQKYLGVGKESNELYKWCSSFYGGEPKGAQRKNIYRAPASLVGKYAESDADLPLRVAPLLYKALQDEGLFEIFEMECKLIRLLIKMRRRGVKVDVPKAEALNIQLAKQRDELQLKLNTMVGFDCDIAKKPPLVKAFNKFGIKYPTTVKGNPSFKGEFLDSIKHPMGELIKEIRKVEKLRGTFVESYIINSHVNGYVYGQFHPMRSEGGGTRSGRYSSSTPNLQNIPSRDKILGPLIRGLFIPDEKDHYWLRFDYSQIEYRMLAHYAEGASGEVIRKAYNDNPLTDYHDLTQDLIKNTTGIILGRKPTKTINFGLIYGMGTSSLATSLNVNFKEAKRLTDAYHRGAPFAKATMNKVSKEAQRTGSVSTILGRKSRFNSWEPTDWDSRTIPLSYDKAQKKWGADIVRAYTYKALNRKLQGSAADLIKMALLHCWESGIFERCGYPALTVHDELDFSMAPGTEKEFQEVVRMMENSIKLRIPVKVSIEIGKDWGHCVEIPDMFSIPKM